MINGYQDHASQGRTPEIATHALTFMAIGYPQEDVHIDGRQNIGKHLITPILNTYFILKSNSM